MNSKSWINRMITAGVVIALACLPLWGQQLTAAKIPADFGEAQWIGAIRFADCHFPEGRTYTGSFLKNAKKEWDAVDTLSCRSICLRREFTLDKPVRSATAYICGLGHYELSLNGRKVGDSEFAPLWSDYDKTVYYNLYDVTAQIQRGDNAVGVLLGNGFFNVQGRGRYRKLEIGFGAPTLLFRLVVDYVDGSRQTLVSNTDWQYEASPITYNSIYGGESYDARLEHKGWNLPGFRQEWRPVVLQEGPKGRLMLQQAAPVKIMEHYGVKRYTKLNAEQVEQASKSTKRTVDPSAFVLDMGQNLSGFPQITLRGKRGQKVTLLVAEALTEEGACNQRQTGRQHYYEYTLKGEKEEVWHPRFSYYGFRYIQVEGAVMKGQKNPRKLPVLVDVQSCFVYNSAPKVSSFECSNEIFNKAHRLIEKAVRSNMQSVFTDCPHREKLGWLEQVHLNGPGLLYNYDLRTYLPKVLRDIADAQQPDGMIPTIAPLYIVFQGKGMDDFANSVEWGSTLILAPFMYYETFGDDTLIREYYGAMRRYVDYLSGRAEGHILSFGLGDWYDYGDFRAGFSRNTPVPLVATAHYYYDLQCLVKAARMVGNAYDEAFYKELMHQVRSAFNARFYNAATGQYGTGSQCSNALPLFLGMADEPQRVLDNLVADVHEHGDRLTTGDVGNRYLFQTLARNGQNELMYKMFNHEEAPGYGFQLKFGATTLTEQWDPRQGSSWNHFMMGQIDEWFFYSLAGIQNRPGTVGYRHIRIAPEVVGDLTYVKASTRTAQGGVIAVEWRRNGQEVVLKVSIPEGSDAEVVLPGSHEVKPVGSGEHEFKSQIK